MFLLALPIDAPEFMKRIFHSSHYFVTAVCQQPPRPPALYLHRNRRCAVSYTQRQLFNKITLTLQSTPHCSLADLSRELGVSRRTIQNAISGVTGKKFRDLRDEAVLERVKNLLTSAPNTAIKELALETGYRSPSAFARAVRRACGISPEELRSRVARKLLARKAWA